MEDQEAGELLGQQQQQQQQLVCGSTEQALRYLVCLMNSDMRMPWDVFCLCPFVAAFTTKVLELSQPQQQQQQQHGAWYA